jgi:cytochrome P450
MSARIPGPGRWTTLQRLLPVPFRRFPNFLSEMTQRYGDVLAFSLPWRSYVFVNDPALVKDILVTQQHAFSKSLGTRVLRLLLGDGLLTSEEPLHRQMRRVVQPAFHRARTMLDEIVYGLIARRRLDPRDRGDALSMLLAAQDTETDASSDEQIRDEIMTLFMAGHETTANTLTWSLFLLAQHDEIDRRAALAACDGDREYLGRVVKEVLRLYPPAWIIGREALRDVTLSDGSHIPAGTTVFMVPLLLHRKPQYFANPDAFEPDRWLEWEPPPFAYIPFGGGARRCIGDEFALRETTIVLETLLRSYRFTLEPGARVETAPLVTLRPAGPVPMRAMARVA